MTTYLVTGSTGRLGSPTATLLRADGHSVRGLTRRGGDGAVVADLLTADGLAEALRGVDTVVHLATTNGKKDVAMAENLTHGARAARVTHFVLISIVGIDKLPMSFYRNRVRVEEIVMRSGIAATIQRATQFHSFVDRLFRSQRYTPVIITPSVRFQPIAVEEVAKRLAELAAGEPQGRAPTSVGQSSVRSGTCIPHGGTRRAAAGVPYRCGCRGRSSRRTRRERTWSPANRSAGRHSSPTYRRSTPERVSAGPAANKDTTNPLAAITSE